MRVRFPSLLLAAAATAALASSCTSSGTPGPAPGPKTSAGAPANPNPAPVTPATQPSQPPVSAPTPQPTALPASYSPAVVPLAAAVPEQPTPSAESQAHRPYRTVLELKRAGASEEELLRAVRSENLRYQLTSAEIRELRDAGVSQTVLEAMLRSGR
jgi:hypothetical protein